MTNALQLNVQVHRKGDESSGDEVPEVLSCCARRHHRAVSRVLSARPVLGRDRRRWTRHLRDLAGDSRVAVAAGRLVRSMTMFASVMSLWNTQRRLTDPVESFITGRTPLMGLTARPTPTVRNRQPEILRKKVCHA